MARRRQGMANHRHSETAAHYLVAGVPRVRAEQTATEALASLRGRRLDSVDILCVVDDEGVLRGIVPIADALVAPPDALVGDLLRPDFPRIMPDEDQEKTASLALHHGLGTLPVVDQHDRLLGVIPAGALLQILRREHVEDLHRFAGITRETHRAREAIEAPPSRRARHRLPWLLVGLLGSMVATSIVAYFEQALASKVSIAFFIPGLVYLADAIGTQTEAVAVRGLSLSHSRLSRLVGGELRTGLLIGLVLGAVTLPIVWVAFGDLRLATAVAAALFCAGGVATTIGLVLPWLLSRLGTDPAYGSGPLATIFQDLLSLVIYFVIVQTFVL